MSSIQDWARSRRPRAGEPGVDRCEDTTFSWAGCEDMTFSWSGIKLVVDLAIETRARGQENGGNGEMVVEGVGGTSVAERIEPRGPESGKGGGNGERVVDIVCGTSVAEWIEIRGPENGETEETGRTSEMVVDEVGGTSVSDWIEIRGPEIGETGRNSEMVVDRVGGTSVAEWIETRGPEIGETGRNSEMVVDRVGGTSVAEWIETRGPEIGETGRNSEMVVDRVGGTSVAEWIETRGPEHGENRETGRNSEMVVDRVGGTSIPEWIETRGPENGETGRNSEMVVDRVGGTSIPEWIETRGPENGETGRNSEMVVDRVGGTSVAEWIETRGPENGENGETGRNSEMVVDRFGGTSVAEWIETRGPENGETERNSEMVVDRFGGSSVAEWIETRGPEHREDGETGGDSEMVVEGVGGTSVADHSIQKRSTDPLQGATDGPGSTQESSSFRHDTDAVEGLLGSPQEKEEEETDCDERQQSDVGWKCGAGAEPEGNTWTPCTWPDWGEPLPPEEEDVEEDIDSAAEVDETLASKKMVSFSDRVTLVDPGSLQKERETGSFSDLGSPDYQLEQCTDQLTSSSDGSCRGLSRVRPVSSSSEKGSLDSEGVSAACHLLELGNESNCLDSEENGCDSPGVSGRRKCEFLELNRDLERLSVLVEKLYAALPQLSILSGSQGSDSSPKVAYWTIAVAKDSGRFRMQRIKCEEEVSESSGLLGVYNIDDENEVLERPPWKRQFKALSNLS